MNQPSEDYEHVNTYTDEQVAIMNAELEGRERVLEEFRMIRDYWTTWALMSKEGQLEYINRIIHRHTL